MGASGRDRRGGLEWRRCYDPDVDRNDVLAFARRDWERLAESKMAYWLTHKSGLSASQILEAGDGLRRHAQAVRPDWPSAARLPAAPFAPIVRPMQTGSRRKRGVPLAERHRIFACRKGVRNRNLVLRPLAAAALP